MRALALVALSAFALAGCAKFPKTGSSDFTHLIFRVTMNGAVNPDYQYFVAIRPLRTSDTQTDTFGPVPVITTGSKNGFVEGRPTRFVQYNPSSPTYYYVNQFGTRTPTSDDDNPVDLGNISIKSTALNGINPLTGGDPNTLGFEITTQDLGDSDIDARSIIAFEFNILTMNRTALNGGDVGSRVLDALGDQRSTTTFNEYRKIIVTTAGTYMSSTSSDPEQANDTYNGNLPSVDIVNWSVEVRPQ